MTVTVTGATGFVGRHLLPVLRERGHDVRTLGRRPVEGGPFYAWSSPEQPPISALDHGGAIIHLAGETVAQRWTRQAKERIRSSRVDSTRNLVAALEKIPDKPAVLLCASASGFYGSRGDEILTETSAAGPGFLADLTRDWENVARSAEAFGVRVVNLRFGLILGSDGGALPKMLTPFRLGVGGRLGSGRQWMPWAHIQDAVALILFALEQSSFRGPFNVTAPNPVTNSDFTRQLACVIHRPAIFPAPRFALKLALGEMSDALLASARVIPAAAQASGYRFAFPTLDAALRDLLGG